MSRLLPALRHARCSRGFGTIWKPVTPTTQDIVPTTEKTDAPVRRIDQETHTHQKWDSDDIRLVRFMNNKKKIINPNRAIDLIAQIPSQSCDNRVVSCDGGGGPLGHPKVYINLDQEGSHSCGYCGLRFHLDQHH